jgi:hypothetical protein
MTNYSDDFLNEARYITMRKSLKYKDGLYDYVIDELCTQLGETQLSDSIVEQIHEMVYNTLCYSDEIIEEIKNNIEKGE